MNRKLCLFKAGWSRSATDRTCSPTIRAASYMDEAEARPSPWSKSRRNNVRIDCEQERFPLVRSTKTRSPGSTIVCIFWQTLTSSRLAFDRESEAITSPSRMMMPRQYVNLASVSNALVFGLAREYCRVPHRNNAANKTHGLDFDGQENKESDWHVNCLIIDKVFLPLSPQQHMSHMHHVKIRIDHGLRD